MGEGLGEGVTDELGGGSGSHASGFEEIGD